MVGAVSLWSLRVVTLAGLAPGARVHHFTGRTLFPGLIPSRNLDYPARATLDAAREARIAHAEDQRRWEPVPLVKYATESGGAQTRSISSNSSPVESNALVARMITGGHSQILWWRQTVGGVG